MIRKYRYGTPFDTEALTEKIETTEGIFPYCLWTGRIQPWNQQERVL